MSWNPEDKKHEIEFSSTWLITYSDMITIILCFFIIFFTFSTKELSALYEVRNTLTAEVEQLHTENTKLRSEKESLAAQLFGLQDIKNDIKTSKEDFISFLREKNLMDAVDILENERGLLIRFKDSILFDSGKAVISEEGYMILHKVGDKLKSINNPIIVEGYTDNIPIRTLEFPSNWELSVARSINVVKFFTEKKGIHKERVSVSGFGEHNPIDTNDTPKGRANNRRIEITIVN